MIDVYYWTTPNGHKVTIFLEETGLKYKIFPVNIGKGEQFQRKFLEVSPNNRIPAGGESDCALWRARDSTSSSSHSFVDNRATPRLVSHHPRGRPDPRSRGCGTAASAARQGKAPRSAMRFWKMELP